MKIETRDFGILELDEKEIVNFVSPIYGFEQLTRYALLRDDEMTGGMLWLQSIEDPAVCFILLDTEEIGLSYHPELPEEAYAMVKGAEGLGIRVIAVVTEDFYQTTVNLKSPVLINPENKLAAQIILDADYPIRMRLFGKEDGAC